MQFQLPIRQFFAPDLTAGDVAIVVGSGGVGSFVVQIANALGARVLACDIIQERLQLIGDYGAAQTINLTNLDPKELRKQARAFAKGVPTLKLKIFECSGSAPGQTTAYGLLERGATMLQVGYTPNPINVRLVEPDGFRRHNSWHLGMSSGSVPGSATADRRRQG